MFPADTGYGAVCAAGRIRFGKSRRVKIHATTDLHQLRQAQEMLRAALSELLPAGPPAEVPATPSAPAVDEARWSAVAMARRALAQMAGAPPAELAVVLSGLAAEGVLERIVRILPDDPALRRLLAELPQGETRPGGSQPAPQPVRPQPGLPAVPQFPPQPGAQTPPDVAAQPGVPMPGAAPSGAPVVPLLPLPGGGQMVPLPGGGGVAPPESAQPGAEGGPVATPRPAPPPRGEPLTYASPGRVRVSIQNAALAILASVPEPLGQAGAHAAVRAIPLPLPPGGAMAPAPGTPPVPQAGGEALRPPSAQPVPVPLNGSTASGAGRAPQLTGTPPPLSAPPLSLPPDGRQRALLRQLIVELAPHATNAGKGELVRLQHYLDHGTAGPAQPAVQKRLPIGEFQRPMRPMNPAAPDTLAKPRPPDRLEFAITLGDAKRAAPALRRLAVRGLALQIETPVPGRTQGEGEGVVRLVLARPDTPGRTPAQQPADRPVPVPGPDLQPAAARQQPVEPGRPAVPNAPGGGNELHQPAPPASSGEAARPAALSEILHQARGEAAPLAADAPMREAGFRTDLPPLVVPAMAGPPRPAPAARTRPARVHADEAAPRADDATDERSHLLPALRPAAGLPVRPADARAWARLATEHIEVRPADPLLLPGAA